jgi:hypothetical protein
MRRWEDVVLVGPWVEKTDREKSLKEIHGSLQSAQILERKALLT